MKQDQNMKKKKHNQKRLMEFLLAYLCERV